MNTMYEAKRWVEENQMPAIVHANVIRMGSHSNSDDHLLYRDENERHCAVASDPTERYRKVLIAAGKFTEDELNKIDEEAKSEVSAAHKAALKAADPTPESIFDFVLPGPHIPAKYPDGLHSETGKTKKLITALNETLKAEFRLNPDTFIWGQDVAHKEKGGIFNVTKGMQQEFGIERVFNAPIAEDFIVGTANGMSRFNKKIRLVIEGAEFADYFWPAMEQFVEMTHEYWRTNGQFSPNVTIRLASGGYIGGGLYHSQTIEGAMATFPGIRIVYPSFADDAAGLLRTSMRSEGPTLFLEPKALYNDPKAEAVVPDDFEVPFGKARIRREGSDLTMVTYGNTTPMCLEVADKLAKESGADIEVIDIRSIIPLDKETILNSVKKTNKAIVVHEDKVFGGFGGEIASMIMEEAFENLDAPVKRVGSTFTPVGFNRILEKAILPDVEKIYVAAKGLMEY
jgi:2-oxoisovalerate dehydrogenase E1 component